MASELLTDYLLVINKMQITITKKQFYVHQIGKTSVWTKRWQGRETA